MLRTGAHPNMKFKQLIVAPYIGDGSPVDQTMWVDNLPVGTGRITPSVPTVASVTVAPASAGEDRARGILERGGERIRTADGHTGRSGGDGNGRHGATGHGQR